MGEWRSAPGGGAPLSAPGAARKHPEEMRGCPGRAWRRWAGVIVWGPGLDLPGAQRGGSRDRPGVRRRAGLGGCGACLRGRAPPIESTRPFTRPAEWIGRWMGQTGDSTTRWMGGTREAQETSLCSSGRRPSCLSPSGRGVEPPRPCFGAGRLEDQWSSAARPAARSARRVCQRCRERQVRPQKIASERFVALRAAPQIGQVRVVTGAAPFTRRRLCLHKRSRPGRSGSREAPAL